MNTTRPAGWMTDRLEDAMLHLRPQEEQQVNALRHPHSDCAAVILPTRAPRARLHDCSACLPYVHGDYSWKMTSTGTGAPLAFWAIPYASWLQNTTALILSVRLQLPYLVVSETSTSWWVSS